MAESERAVPTQAVEVPTSGVIFDVAALAVDFDPETGERQIFSEVGVDVVSVVGEYVGEVGVRIRHRSRSVTEGCGDRITPGGVIHAKR